MKRLAFLAVMLSVSTPAWAERITIMTYNLGNFFDAVDDPRVPNGEQGEVIQSKSWVKAKGEAVARVIARFDFNKGPDVLVLTEIESRAALDTLRAALPKPDDYPTVVFFDADPARPDPKPDARGIKVAMLSKLPIAAGTAPAFHPIDLSVAEVCKGKKGEPKGTRDILSVTLRLPDGEPLTVFGAHLSSGLNNPVCRRIGLRTLAALAAAVPAQAVVAAGDFNFNCGAEDQKDLREILAGWSVPPQLDNGCRYHGTHIHTEEDGSVTWSYLDVVAQRSGGTPWRLDLRTFGAVQVDKQQFFWKASLSSLVPLQFFFNTVKGKGSGTSDHWPVAADIVKR